MVAPLLNLGIFMLKAPARACRFWLPSTIGKQPRSREALALTPRIRGQAGFTLIEITVAIVILATSLIILLGLQSSSVQRAVYDRNAQQAMLIAREILSAIDIAKDPGLLGEAFGSPEEVLRDVLGSASLPADGLDPAGKFDVDLKFEEIELPIPNLGSEHLRKATLAIRWPGSPEQGLVIDYYLVVG